MEDGSERNIFNTNQTLQRCFLTRNRLTLVDVAMITPLTPLKTHNKDTTAVETQGNRRREWADLKVICNEYAVILKTACKDY